MFTTMESVLEKWEDNQCIPDAIRKNHFDVKRNYIDKDKTIRWSKKYMQTVQKPANSMLECLSYKKKL